MIPSQKRSPYEEEWVVVWIEDNCQGVFWTGYYNNYSGSWATCLSMAAKMNLWSAYEIVYGFPASNGEYFCQNINTHEVVKIK